jgi:hypothetical protein
LGVACDEPKAECPCDCGKPLSRDEIMDIRKLIRAVR